MLSNIQLFLLAFLLSFFNWLMTFLGSSLVYFVKNKSQKLISSALGLRISSPSPWAKRTVRSFLTPAIWNMSTHRLNWKAQELSSPAATRNAALATPNTTSAAASARLLWLRFRKSKTSRALASWPRKSLRQWKMPSKIRSARNVQNMLFTRTREPFRPLQL